VHQVVNGISGGIQSLLGSTVKEKIGVVAGSDFLAKSVLEFEQSCSMV